ncbi:hypothetical protein EJB05_51327, partial [Eragrostis curvula]
MGKKPGGAGAGWLATVRKVFKPASSKDPRHAKKQKGASEVEAGGEAAEVVSVEHFPTAETSPEVTNEGIGGAVVWLGREDDYAEVAGACRRERHHRGMAASSRVVRTAAARWRTGGREERAAVRIQAFYRGYLARRALRALRGLVRLQALVRGHQVRRQVQRTMLCMQALVRAQDRVRARRLVTSPYAAGWRALCRPAPLRHPSLVPVASRHGAGRRSSFGHDRVDAEVEGQQQARPPRHSNASPFLQQQTWDAAIRADTAGESAPTYAYNGFQHRQRQTDESQERDARNNAGWRHWMEACDAGVQPPQQHAPEHHTNQVQHGAAETSYVTAAATEGFSENTVEMDAAACSSRRSPTRDLYPVVRPPAILPGYMAATQSARAKARSTAPPPAPKAHARTRSGSSTANSGWTVSHNGSSGGARAPHQRPATHSPESSCSGDRTPPALGGPSRPAFA